MYSWTEMFVYLSYAHLFITIHMLCGKCHCTVKLKELQFSLRWMHFIIIIINLGIQLYSVLMYYDRSILNFYFYIWVYIL